MKNEKGFYTLFTSICLVMFILVFGMALDSGKLELNRSRLQRAADAGAVVGGSRIGDISKSNVEKLALLVAQDNMKVTNLSLSNSNSIQARMLTANDLEVSTSTITQSFFIGKVMPAQVDHNLNTTAASRKRPVAVVLVLDISGSMNEFVSSNCILCPKQTRLQALKSAAKTFVNSFDDTKDAFSLVTYSNNSYVNYPLSKPFSKAQLSQVIDNLQSEQWTNTHSGMLSARLQLDSLEAVVGSGYDAFQKVIVIITDGAPNRNSALSYPAVCPSDQNKKDVILPIVEADYARNDGAVVFGVGIGEQDNNTSTAFQTQPTSSDPGLRLLKRIMFKRLVNDQLQGSNDPAFPLTCIPGYKEISNKPVGKYLESSDAQDISYMLNEVSLSIQMKLTK